MPVGKGSKSGVGAAGRDDEAVHKMKDDLQVASLLGLPMVPASLIRCCCHQFSFFTSFTSFLDDDRLFGKLRSNPIFPALGPPARFPLVEIRPERNVVPWHVLQRHRQPCTHETSQHGVLPTTEDVVTLLRTKPGTED